MLSIENRKQSNCQNYLFGKAYVRYISFTCSSVLKARFFNTTYCKEETNFCPCNGHSFYPSSVSILHLIHSFSISIFKMGGSSLLAGDTCINYILRKYSHTTHSVLWFL